MLNDGGHIVYDILKNAILAIKHFCKSWSHEITLFSLISCTEKSYNKNIDVFYKLISNYNSKILIEDYDILFNFRLGRTFT